MNLKNYNFKRFIIQDPIHGAITFGKIEGEIINHQFFQRLHGLRQNSLLYLVFPSANHTRFDHSLGVMCLAEEFFESIIHNQREICRKGKKRTKFEKKYRVDNLDILETIDELSKNQYYKLIVRLGGLMHDIGHGPFSHLFEKFFPNGRYFKKLLKNDKRYSHIYERICQFSNRELNDPITHELNSCIVCTKVILDCSKVLKGFNLDPLKISRDVCSLIVKEIKSSDQLEKCKCRVQLLMSDIISNDIDADRMDYLLRDSHMCGVNYGLYEPSRILKSMCAYGIITQNETTLRVGIRYSGLGALEDLLFSRYQMHKQVYGHKTNRSCNVMLDQIRGRLDKKGWTWFKDYKNLNALLKKFGAYDDSKFIQELFIVQETSKKLDSEIKEIAQKLFIERKLMKKIFEEMAVGKRDEDRVEIKIKLIKGELNNSGIRYKIDKFENKNPGFEDPSYSLKILKKSNSGYYLVKSLYESSPYIKGLPKREKIFRMFCKRSKRKDAKELINNLNLGG